MASIERDICKAIDIIASKAVASSNHGSTILATVVEYMNPLTGKYKLKYQTKEFIAYSESKVHYKENAGVYVFLPNGTFDKQCFILGSVNGINVFDATQQIIGVEMEPYKTGLKTKVYYQEKNNLSNKIYFSVSEIQSYEWQKIDRTNGNLVLLDNHTPYLLDVDLNNYYYACIVSFKGVTPTFRGVYNI